MRVCQFRHFGIEMRRQCTTGACDGKYLSILKGLLNVSNSRLSEQREKHIEKIILAVRGTMAVMLALTVIPPG